MFLTIDYSKNNCKDIQKDITLLSYIIYITAHKQVTPTDHSIRIQNKIEECQ